MPSVHTRSPPGLLPLQQMCASPEVLRTSRACSRDVRSRGSRAHVQVDVHAMRQLLAEWRERGLQGGVPTGLRTMSQCALTS